MLTLFLRGAILYIVMIATMRGLGKRQLGEFEPYELAMTILLAEVISGPMSSVSIPLLHGLLPVAAMFVVHGVITLACLKWDRLRGLVSGHPAVVVDRGVVDPRALDKLCLSLSDLLEGLRGAGYPDPTEVGTAIVEANGTISAFPGAQSRPPRASELGIAVEEEGLPLMLVLDGKPQWHNLARGGHSRAWLQGMLSSRGIAFEQVYLGQLDARDRVTLQLRRGDVVRFQAPEEGAVNG